MCYGSCSSLNTSNSSLSCWGYILKFEDNFSGNALDMTQWELQTSHQAKTTINCKSGEPSQSQELNTLDNVEVSNGSLKIIAKKQTVQGRAVNWKQDYELLCDGLPNLRSFNYTSSNLWTKQKFKALGKYEIRFKMPDGQGFWPAFWTFSGSDLQGERWNEIDFIDNLKGNTRYSVGVINDYDNDGDKDECRSGSSSIPDFSQWHTFTCIYETDKITWYIDGSPHKVMYRNFTLAGAYIPCGGATGGSIYLKGMHFPIADMQIILNLAILRGKDAPDQNTVFPSAFEIDYIRYWEGPQLPAVLCGYNANVTGPFTGTVKHVDNVTFGSNASLYGSSSITATKSIKFGPNFRAHVTGSNTFRAKISPNQCGTYLRKEEVEGGAALGSAQVVSNNEKVGGLKAIDSFVAFTVYPNPNNGEFEVKISANEQFVELELLDLFGKIIAQERSSKNSFTFNLSKYAKGIYVLRAIVGNKTHVQKVVYQ